MEYYFPQEKFPYILVDGHPMTTSNFMRVRSHIFPQNGILMPIIFFPNPHSQ